MTKMADLSKYLRPGQELVPAPVTARPVQPTSALQPYEAYRLSQEPKRHLELRIKFPEPAECPLNSSITNIRGEWRMGLAVTLLYGNIMMVQIKGERLQALFEALKDWKVDWIAEFDPQEHAPPTDDNAPFIRSIEILTERPESHPPLQQRH